MQARSRGRRFDAASAVVAAIVAPLAGAAAGSVLFFTVIPGSELAAWLAPVLAIAALTAAGFARLRGMRPGPTVALVAIALVATLGLFLALLLLLAALAGGFDSFD